MVSHSVSVLVDRLPALLAEDVRAYLAGARLSPTLNRALLQDPAVVGVLDAVFAEDAQALRESMGCAPDCAPLVPDRWAA
jgi:hypothetical protein